MECCVAMRMNKQTSTTYNNMDEFHRHHSEQKKPDTKEKILYKTLNAKHNRQICAVKRQIRIYCRGEVTGREFKGSPGCWSCFLIWYRCVHFGET